MDGRIIRPEKSSGLILPRIGFVKTGFKNAKGYPQSCDYFIAKGKYSGLFDKVYSKPQTLQIVFISDNPEEVCNERYEYRDKQGKLYAFGDGEFFEIWDGKKYQVAAKNEHPEIMQIVEKRCESPKGWEVILTLRFILPKIQGIAGVWEYSTKGAASSVPNIRKTFDAMQENRGFVKGIIFDLSVEFAVSQKPNTKSRYPVVSLIPNQSEENMQMLKDNQIYKPKELTE